MLIGAMPRAGLVTFLICGIGSNVAFAGIFVPYYHFFGPNSALDVICWVAASLGLFLLRRPTSFPPIVLISLYNLYTNFWLAVVLACAVFGNCL